MTGMPTGAIDMRLIMDYALSFVGKAYVWGGSGPSAFDCSGLVIEILKARGLVPNKFDATSHELYQATMQNEVLRPEPHAIVFYGKTPATGGRITHCGYVVSPNLVLEAAGGNSKTHSVADADKLNNAAMVRIRPINYRKDLVSIHRV